MGKFTGIDLPICAFRLSALNARLADNCLCRFVFCFFVAKEIVLPRVPFALALVETYCAAGGPVYDIHFEEECFACLVNEETVIGRASSLGITVDIVDVVPSQNCSRLKSQRVDAGAVGELFHYIVNVVVLNDTSRLRRWRRVPPETEGDARVGHVVDVVVSNPGIGGKSGEDTATASAVRTASLDMAICDLIAGWRIGRFFPVRVQVSPFELAYSAPSDHDAVSSNVLDCATNDDVLPTSGTETDP